MIRNASYPQIRMQPGTLIAVIGYSRSGKSTFLAVRCGPTKNKWDGDLGHWTLEKNRYGKIGIKGKI